MASEAPAITEKGRDALRAQKELEKILLDEARIYCKLSELERMYSLAEKMTAAMGKEPVAGSRNLDPMGDAATDILMLKDEIRKLKAEYERRKSYFAGIIDNLPKPAQIRVLYGVYFEGKTQADMARELHYSDRNIRNIHDAALLIVEKKLKSSKSFHTFS